MIKVNISILLLFIVGFIVNSASVQTPERIADYIHWYPAIQQVEMRDKCLNTYQPGEWQFTDMVTSNDKTVITPL